MSDFTPGPWKCDSGGVWSDEFGWVLEPDSDKCYIKVVDMHLIAEAPSMYAALERIVTEYDGVLPPYSGVVTDASIALARSILTRARGE